MPPLNSARDHAVQRMFDRIAGRYDLLNRVISFRLDTRWRNQAIRAIVSGDNATILDLGTGTGDLTFAAARAGAACVVGLDFSFPMLRLAQQKRRATPFGEKAYFVLGSALESPFKNAAFDGVMTAFVLRNVSDFRRRRTGFRFFTRFTFTDLCLGLVACWPATATLISISPSQFDNFIPPRRWLFSSTRPDSNALPCENSSAAPSACTWRRSPTTWRKSVSLDI